MKFQISRILTNGITALGRITLRTLPPGACFLQVLLKISYGERVHHWLKLSDKHWPSSEIKLENPPEECWKEMKVKHLPPEMSKSVLLKKCDIPVGISNMIQCDTFSSYSKLIRVAGHVIKFVQALLSRIKEKKEIKPTSSVLTLHKNFQRQSKCGSLMYSIY